MSRQHVGLRSPTPRSVRRVPVVSHHDTTLHRVVHRDHPQPWHFATRDLAVGRGGRFDLPAPAGTCYLATTAATALLERLADPAAAGPPYASLRSLRELTVWSGAVPSADDLADATTASVPELTGELATITPYDLCWQWADAFAAAGRGGLLYRGRFGRGEAIALFDARGGTPADATDPRHRGTLTATPAVTLRDELPAPLRAHLGQPAYTDDFQAATDP